MQTLRILIFNLLLCVFYNCAPLATEGFKEDFVVSTSQSSEIDNNSSKNNEEDEEDDDDDEDEKEVDISGPEFSKGEEIPETGGTPITRDL